MTDLAELEIRIKTDSAKGGIRELRSELDRFGQSGDKAARSADEISASFNELGATAKAVDALSRAASGLFQVVGAGLRQINSMERAFAAFEVAVAASRGGIRGVAVELAESSGAFRETEESASKTATAFGLVAKALAAVGISLGATEFVRLIDQFNSLRGQLTLVTDSGRELDEVFDALFRSAQDAGQGVSGTVELYARLARSTEELNLSQDSLLEITDTVNKALAASKAPAESAQAALFQLSQGMAAGALRGDELNSVMEQTPRLARAIADGLNIPIGKLRELGEQGELTAEKVITALQRQRDVIEREFSQLGLTLSQQVTQLENALVNFAGNIDQRVSISSVIGDQIEDLTERLGRPEVINATVAAMEKLAVVMRLAGQAISFVLDNVDTLIKLFIALNAGRALAGLVLAFGAARNGALLLSGALAAVGVQAGLATRAFGGLAAAMAFANPLGILVAGFTALAGVLILTSSRATESQKATESYRSALADLGRTAEDVEESLSRMTDAQREQAALDTVRNIEAQTQALRALREEAEELLSFAFLDQNQEAVLSPDFAKTFADANDALRGFLDDVEAGNKTLKQAAEEFLNIEELAKRDAERLTELAGEMDTTRQQADRLEALFKILTGTATDADRALFGLRDAVFASGDAARASQSDWESFIGTLERARDTFALTAAEQAAFEASAKGFSDAQARVASSVAGQVQALRDYEGAIRKADQAQAESLRTQAAALAQQEAQAAGAIKFTETLAAATASGILSMTEAVTAAKQAQQETVQAVESDALGKLEQAFARIEKTTEPTARGVRKVNTALREQTKAADDAARAQEEYENRLRGTLESLNPVDRATREYVETVRTLLEAIGKKDISQEKFNKTLAAAEARYNDVTQPLNAYLQGLREELALTRILDDQEREVAAALLDVADAYQQIGEAIPENAESEIRATISAIRDANRAAEEFAEQQDIARDAAERFTTSSVDFARSWVNALDQVGDAIADGLVNGFKDASDLVKRIFNDLLVALIRAAVVNPILLQLGFAGLGGLGFGSAALAGGAQLAGAGAAAAGGGGVFNGIGSIFSGLGSNSFGTGLGNFAPGLFGGSSGFGSTGATAAGGGIFSFGTGGAGAASISNAAFGLYGIGGGLIGNQLFGGGTGASLGGSLGAVGGAAFGASAGASLGAFAGPIGAIAGAVIGSALGSLFDSSYTPFPFSTVNIGASSFGTNDIGLDGPNTQRAPTVTGASGLQFEAVVKHENLDDAIALRDALLDLDATLSQLAPGTNLAGREFGTFGNTPSGLIAGSDDPLAFETDLIEVAEGLQNFVGDTQELTAEFIKNWVAASDVVNERVKQIVAGFEGGGEELLQTFQALQGIEGAIDALTNQIDRFGETAEEAASRQLRELDQAISNTFASLREAVDAQNFVQVAQLAQQAQALVVQRYEVEIQLAQQLLAQVQQIRAAAEQFDLNIRERINQIQPDFTGTAGEQFSQFEQRLPEIQDPGERINFLGQGADLVEASLNEAINNVNLNLQNQLRALEEQARAQEQAARDRINAQVRSLEQQKAALQDQTRDQIRALQDQKSLIEDAARERIDALQEELRLAEQWNSVIAATDRLLDQLTFTRASPLPTGARLNLAGEEVERLREAFEGATGQERQDIAGELLSALETQLGLAQEFFQRPSPEYEELYNQIVREVNALRDEAVSEADRALLIQQQILAVNEQKLSEIAAIDRKIAAVEEAQAAQLASIDQQIEATRNQVVSAQIQTAAQAERLQEQANAEIQALRDQAVDRLESIRAEAAAAFEALETQLVEQSGIQLNGLTLDEFIAAKQAEAVTLLAQIRDALAGSFGGGSAGSTIPQAEADARLREALERRLENNGELTPRFQEKLRTLSGGSFASGSEFVPRDMLAQVHRGERIIPANRVRDESRPSQTVNFSPTINVSGGTDARRSADEIRRTITDMLPAIRRQLRTA